MNAFLEIPWKNQKLIATLHLPDSQGEENHSYPLVIICHGFTSNRMGVDRLFVKTADEFIQQQIAVLRFDYSGCGESSGDYGDTGLDEIIEQTIRVIDYASKIDEIDKDNITLLGHSLGGATALLTSIEDKRIRKLILWAAVGNPYEDILNIVGTKKLKTFIASNSVDYLGYSFTKKYFRSLNKYDPLTACSKFTGDILLIHGSDDGDIPVSYCKQFERQFHKRKQGSCSSYILQGANHTFSCMTHFKELMSLTLDWSSEYVKHKEKSSKIV